MAAPISSQELPREKIARHGAEVLSDAELLAIFLRTGCVGRNVLQVAEELITTWGTLRRLAGCSIEELSQISGIGFAKAAELKAAFEMGRRMILPEKERQPLLKGFLIYELMKGTLQLLPYESVWVLLLNTRYSLLDQQEVSRGTLAQSLAHPREIFKQAIAKRAYAIALVHNHPSGDPWPSEADRALTRRLQDAGELLQIPLWDHVIVGTESGTRKPYFSFRDAHLL